MTEKMEEVKLCSQSLSAADPGPGVVTKSEILPERKPYGSHDFSKNLKKWSKSILKYHNK